jgi:hypothetical protein
MDNSRNKKRIFEPIMDIKDSRSLSTNDLKASQNLGNLRKSRVGKRRKF